MPVGPTMTRWLASRIHCQVAKCLKERMVKASSGAIVDVLNDGGLTEFGTGQATREAAVVASGALAINEETEQIDVRHPGRLGIVLQFGEGIEGAPDESGKRRCNRGLARAGNPRVRRGIIEFAWRFLQSKNDGRMSRFRFGRERRTAAAPRADSARGAGAKVLN